MLQPSLAIFGFVGCFVIIFVFTTSLFWIGQPRAQVVIAFEAIPVLLVLLWLLLKLRRYVVDGSPSRTSRKTGQRGFWWVNIDGDIRDTINVITWLKDNQRADEEIELNSRGN